MNGVLGIKRLLVLCYSKKRGGRGAAIFKYKVFQKDTL